MNSYPNNQSVLVMVNCCIHHNDLLKEIVNSEDMVSLFDDIFMYSSRVQGIMILYLPPYLPDLNPIEESFSKCKTSFAILQHYNTHLILQGSHTYMLMVF